MLIRAAALVMFPLALAGAQTSDSSPIFKGRIAEGSWLRVRTMKGSVEVREAAGSDVVVTARKRYSIRAAGEITFEVRRDGSNVTVCAIWERTSRCDANGYESRFARNERRDWDVGMADFVVEIPKGVRLVASTGNGQIDIRNVGGELEASSGNGEVTVNGASSSVVATSGNGDVQVNRAGGFVNAHSGNGNISVTTARGPVTATTGNGRIDVDMASVPRDGDMDFSTGNGSITVDVPADISAVIEGNVSYNNFTTDFPVEVPAHWSSRRIQGTIGGGGRRIHFSTGNGRVTLRKHGQA